MNKQFTPNKNVNSYLLQAMIDYIKFGCGGVPLIQVWRGYQNLNDSLPPANKGENPHVLVVNVNYDVSVKYFVIEGDVVYFEGRFSGAIRRLAIPIEAITTVWDRENLETGMVFQALAIPKEEEKPAEKPRPKLTLVKG